ncbi:MAG TPA: CHRD domain-containing protein [Acidimicrobiales bacterium]|nr:CHRD domain-containing protein [Acidimicrobiales bacterium]
MFRRLILGAAALTMVAVGVNAAPAQAADAQLYTQLYGSNERPGPGDPDGTGQAYITVEDGANRLCLTLQFARIALPTTGIHIHKAPRTSSGPVVIAFKQTYWNQTYQCVTVANEALLDDIAARPWAYYLNVHNNQYPAGAIRGQLRHA